MKLKKGDKLTFVGFEKDSQNNLSKLIFETSGLNKLEIYADGEKYQYHNIGVRIVDERKPSEDLEIP